MTPVFNTSQENLKMHIGANVVIPGQIHYKLLCKQPKFPRIFSQNGQNDFESQDHLLPFSIPAESMLGCMFGTNLMIPSQICDELSCGQGKVHGQMDR